MIDDTIEITRIFGAAVKARRESLRIKQAELAKAAGTSPTTLSSIENGKTATNLAEISRLCSALGVEPWELLKPIDTHPSLPSRAELLGEALTLLTTMSPDRLSAVLRYLRALK